MLPRLGGTYGLEVETTSKPRAEFQTAAWRATGLSAAPAVMIDDEVVVARKDIAEEELEAAIRRRLGLPPLETGGKKGLLDRMLGR